MLGNPSSKEFMDTLNLIFLSSGDSLAKFALILSSFILSSLPREPNELSEPDAITELAIQIIPILPVIRYALSIPNIVIDIIMLITDNPTPYNKYFKRTPLSYLLLRTKFHFVSF